MSRPKHAAIGDAPSATSWAVFHPGQFAARQSLIFPSSPFPVSDALRRAQQFLDTTIYRIIGKSADRRVSIKAISCPCYCLAQDEMDDRLTHDG